MKTETRRYVTIAAIVFILFLGIHYWENIQGLLALAFSAALPLIVGSIIAFPVNILMSFYERHYFPHSQKKAVRKSRRVVCLVAALLTMVCIIALVIGLIVPEFVDCIMLLVSLIPGAMEKVIDYIETLNILPEDIFAVLENIDWKSRIGEIVNSLWSGVGSVMDIAIKAVSSVFSVIVTALVAIIFSLYLLIGKERVGGQCRRLLARYLRPHIYEKVMHVLGVVNDCFRRYVVGQCLEAVILGVLCTVGMLIFRFPYATMIGALIAFTALIPVAGAYIGAFVGAFMILTVSPIQAVLFIVYIVVLQQLEGNIIYPRVVGSSLGLPGIWVLAAVTVGGGVMGIFGMLLGVPLAAALYRLLREDVNRDAVNQTVKAETVSALVGKPVGEAEAAPVIGVIPAPAEPKVSPKVPKTAPRPSKNRKKNSKK